VSYVTLAIAFETKKLKIFQTSRKLAATRKILKFIELRRECHIFIMSALFYGYSKAINNSNYSIIEILQILLFINNYMIKTKDFGILNIKKFK